jgi:Protein of unknown function (DUF2807).
MPRVSLPLLIVVTVLVAAALAWWTLGRNFAGRASTHIEHVDLASFHAVEVGGAASVTLVQGDASSIDVTASDRGTRVDTTVRNGRLTIRARDRRRGWRGLFGHRTAAPPAIVVRFRDLDVIALSGNVSVDVPKLHTTSLRIVASGGTSVSIGKLDATSVSVEGSGALQATLAGRVDDETIRISGAGSYDGERLVASRADVAVSGVGDVVVHAEQTLRASISGAGSIQYVGDPQVTEHVSGIGRVIRRDAPPNPNKRASRAPGQRTGIAALPLKNSGPPVTVSMSGWTPDITRTSATLQSRSSVSSIVATSPTVSYG